MTAFIIQSLQSARNIFYYCAESDRYFSVTSGQTSHNAASTLSQINFHPFCTSQNCYFSRLLYIYYCTLQVLWTKYTFHTEMVSNVRGSFFVFLTFNLLISWQLSIWNCCHPFFSLLYNCQLLCFWWLVLSTAVEVFPRLFFRILHLHGYLLQTHFFLSVFRHIGKTVQKWLLVSSCLSICTEQLGSQWTNFHEISY
jgi:hypothetical protein